MAQTQSTDAIVSGTQASVSHTLAQLLHALSLGASVTFSYPDNSTVTARGSSPNGPPAVAPSPAAVQDPAPAVASAPGPVESPETEGPPAPASVVAPAIAPTTPVMVEMLPAAVQFGAYGSDVADINTRYYIITKGTRVGVFIGWSAATHFVTGVKKGAFAKFEGINARNQAMEAFNKAFLDGAVLIL